MGAAYDISINGVVVLCIVLQLAAIPVFLKVRKLAQARPRG